MVNVILTETETAQIREWMAGGETAKAQAFVLEKLEQARRYAHIEQSQERPAIDEYTYTQDVQEPSAIDMIPAGTHAEKKVSEAIDDLNVAVEHLEMGGDWKHVLHLIKRALWGLRPRRRGER